METQSQLGVEDAIGILFSIQTLLSLLISAAMWLITRRDLHARLSLFWLSGVLAVIGQVATRPYGPDAQLLAFVTVAPSMLILASLCAQVGKYSFSYRGYLLSDAAAFGITLLGLKMEAPWLALCFFIPVAAAAPVIVIFFKAASNRFKGLSPSEVGFLLFTLGSSVNVSSFSVLHRYPATFVGGNMIAIALAFGIMAFALSVAVEQIAMENARLALVAEYEGKLVHAARMSGIGELAGNVAHELNNPLATILLQLDVMTPLDEPLAGELLKIQSLCTRMSRIVRSLIIFSGASKQFESSSVTSQEIVAGVLDLIGEAAKGQGIRIEEKSTGDFPLSGSAKELMESLLNLVTNALEAVEGLENKWVRIESELLNGNHVAISVIDSGRGVPSEIREKIMLPFFSTKPELSKGSGLGLSVAQGIAKKHAGRVEHVADAPHTTFRLVLPLQTEPGP